MGAAHRATAGQAGITHQGGAGHIPKGRIYDGLICTMDFYATAAAVAARSLPKRCDGQNLLPYLRGEKNGDAHEELYWCNDDQKDASRRHLKAVRWKQ